MGIQKMKKVDEYVKGVIRLRLIENRALIRKNYVPFLQLGVKIVELSEFMKDKQHVHKPLIGRKKKK